MDDTRRPRLAARALWICALLALIAASVLGVTLPAEQAAAQAFGGRQFKLTSIGGGQIRLDWATGTGQSGYRLNRITTGGSVVVATPASTATTFTDTLPSTVNVACYQLEILGTGTTVLGRSDILCAIVFVAGGASPVRNVAIQTNETPLAIISWQAPASGTPIGYLVVPLGRTPLSILPPNALQAVDAPSGPTCYIVLTLISDSALAPFRIGGFSDIVCAFPGTFTPQPTATTTSTPTRTNTVGTAVSTSTSTATTGTAAPTSTGTVAATATSTSTFTPANIQIVKQIVTSGGTLVKNSTVNAGNPVTFRVTITNAGQSTSSGLTVQDPVPAGLTFQNATPPCNWESSTNIVGCSLSPLAGGQSVSVDITMQVQNPCLVVSPIRNTAQLIVGTSTTPSASDFADVTVPQCTQATSTSTATPTRTATGTITLTPTISLTPTLSPTPGVDLTIAKIDSPDPIDPTTQPSLVYNIQVTNQGSSSVTGVLVRDTLPQPFPNPNYTFGNALVLNGNGSCGAAPSSTGVLDCTINTLGPSGGATIQITLNVNTSCTTGTYLLNNVVVNPLNQPPESNTSNNSAYAQTACGAGANTATPLPTSTSTATPTPTSTSVVTTVPTTSAGFLKVDSPDPTSAGGPLNFDLTLTNTSGTTMTGVAITDTLPTDVFWLSQTVISGGFVCNHIGANPGGQVVCTNGTIPAGSSGVIRIFTTVASGACSSPIVNTATVVSPAIANFTATSSTTATGCTTVTPTTTSTSTPTTTTTPTPTATLTVVPTLDIAITKTAPATATTGSPISYTISVPVTGSGTASGVVVVDTLPKNDTVPLVAFTSASGDHGFTCTQSAGVVTCSGGSIPAGQTATITINGTVTGCGVLSNTAQVDPNNTIPETNEANNITSAGTTVACDVSVTKVGTPTAVNTAGGAQTVTYTITLDDLLGTRVPPSKVEDTLPPGFVFQSAAVTTGSGTCSQSAGVVTCSNVTSASNTAVVTITVSVPTSLARDDYTNSVVVTTDGDTNTANNSTSTKTSVYNFDLAVAVADNIDPVVSPTQYTYTITVMNTSAGGFGSGGFFVSGGLNIRSAAGKSTGADINGGCSGNPCAAVVSVTSTDFTCTFPAPLGPLNLGNPQRYNCAIGNLAASATATITVVVNALNPELDGAPDVGLDATISTTSPVLSCVGGGTDNACAPESNSGAFTNPAPAATLLNNRAFQLTDID